MVQAILFDAYGTLFDVFALQNQLAVLYGAEAATAINALWREKQLNYTWLREIMGCYVPFSQLTGEALDYAVTAVTQAPPKATERESLLAAYLELPVFQELPALLNHLSEHYALGILTNADLHLVEHAVRFNQLDMLTHVISAQRCQHFKPAPEVYALGPERLHLQASEIAFVSANGWDVAGAAHFGYQSVWLRRQPVPAEQLQQPEFTVIQDLSALKTILA